jgi:hypothetical protein
MEGVGSRLLEKQRVPVYLMLLSMIDPQAMSSFASSID